MLTIDSHARVVAELRALPSVTRSGLVLMAAAGAMDVIVHATAGDHGHHGFGPEHVAHLLGVVGMVFVLAGVVIHGARRQLRRAAANTWRSRPQCPSVTSSTSSRPRSSC